MRREGGRGGFEDSSAVGRKDYARSDSDNWRTLREEQEEMEGVEPGGSWRIAGGRRDGTHMLRGLCKILFKKEPNFTLFSTF